MIYLLIILLLAVLGYLLWLQKQKVTAWQNELANLYHSSDSQVANNHASNTHEKTVPEAMIATEELPFQLTSSDEQSHDNIATEPLHDTLNHQEVSTINIELNEIEVQPETIEIHSIDLTQTYDVSMDTEIAEAETNTAREIITIEEATRFLHRPLTDVEQKQELIPDVVIKAEKKAVIITPDSPDIARVLKRTQREKALLLNAENPIATQKIVTQTSKPEAKISVQHSALTDDASLIHEANESSSPEIDDTTPINADVANREQKDLPIIDLHDIEGNLTRQKLARETLAAQTISTKPQINSMLPEIPADEVWANLTHTNSPAARRHRHQMQQTAQIAKSTSADLSAKIVSSTNRYTPPQPQNGVAIASPVAMQPEILPTPEIVKPVYFSDNPHHDVSSDSTQWLDNAYSDIQAAPNVSMSQEESSSFCEEDFEAYYQSSLDDLSSYAEKESIPSSGHFATTPSMQPESILPPLNLLLPPIHDAQAVQTPETLLDNSIIIEEKLAEYRVKVKVLDAYAGPVITRYEIEPDVGVRGNSVLNLEKDLARSLGVAAIRVVETIPGRTCMGLELPNPKRQMIRLREIFDSPAFTNSTSQLTLALGQDITGEPVVTDLAKAPHLLVAGTTGSGKSVGVNSMILSMLYKATPEEVRMIMIDPKMLELSIYEGIPHLLAPVVTDMKLAANALTWCVNEMEKRYRLMSHVGVRNLASYNQKIRDADARGQKLANPFSFTPNDPEPLEVLPSIVVIVDEFADLMMVSGKQIEQLIARLAQKARAAGIHLILATQRPSVDVITGLIKANIPTRIAFQVSTKIDSRTILDQMGAENLLGQGDMLFLPPGTGYPQRVHGAFVADSEVHAVVDYLKQFGEPEYIDDILMPEQEEFNFGVGGNSNERDPLFDQAIEVIMRTKKATISSLQRHLRIGYNKAATIIEQLEAEGIVSAADHTGKRTILTKITPDDYNRS